MINKALSKRRRVGRSKPFDPSSLGGLVTWVSAKKSVKTFNGNQVSQIDDLSGNGNHFQSAVSGNQPIFVTDPVNNLQYLRFDGSNDIMNTIDPVSFGDFTVFAVFRCDARSFIYEHSVTMNANDGGGLIAGVAESINVVRNSQVDQSRRDITTDGDHLLNDNNWRVATHIYGGTIASHKLYINGEDIPTTAGIPDTATEPGSSVVTARIYLGDRTTGNPVIPLRGDLAEFMIFDRELSDLERIKVENYLSNQLPSTALPTDYSGLVAWWDPNNKTGITLNSGDVSQINDRSSNNNHLVQGTASKQPVYAENAINKLSFMEFDGTNHAMASTNTHNINSDKVTVFMVMQNNTDNLADTNFKVPFEFSTNFNSVNDAFLVSLERQDVHDVDGLELTTRDANGYDGYCIKGYPRGLNVYTFTFDRSLDNPAGRIFINGVLQSRIGGDVNNAGGNFGTHKLFVGARNEASAFFNGLIGEIVVYDNILSDSEQKQIENYLMSKWEVQFSPSLIDDMSLWMDATDRSTITLNGNTVSSWKDKSGNGYDFVQASSSNQPTYHNGFDGLGGIYFSQSKYLQDTTYALTDDQTVIIVFEHGNQTSGGSVHRPLFASVTDPYVSNSNGFGMGVYQQGSDSYNLNVPDTGAGNEIVSAQTVSNRLEMYIVQATGADYELFKNDSSLGTFTADKTSGFNTGFSIAAHPTGFPNRFFQGVMKEIIIFDREITDDEFATVKNYLRQKHNFAFSPNDVSSIQMWIDASSKEFVTSSSGAISQVSDRSRNSNDATQSTEAEKPTLVESATNGLDVMQFDGTDDNLEITAGLVDKDFSIFVVASKSDTSDGTIISERSATPIRYEIGSTGSFSKVENRDDSGTAQTFTGGLMETNRYYVISAISDATTGLEMYLNGVSQGSLDNNLSATASATAFIGTSSQDNPWAGNIGEIIVCNDKIDAAVRTNIENYLIEKWGIEFRPTDIDGCLAWIDFTDSSTVTLNGSTISQVTDKSGNGETFVQASSGSQPTLVENVINGLSVASFDGVDDYMTSQSTLSMSDFTVYAVWKSNTTTDSMLLYELSADNNSNDGFYLNLDDGATIAVVKQHPSSVVSTYNDSNNWAHDNQWRYTCHQFDDTHASHVLFDRNQQIATSTSTGSDPGSGTMTDTFYLCSRGGSTLFVEGYVAELIIYDSKLDKRTKFKVEEYLRKKYLIRRT